MITLIGCSSCGSNSNSDNTPIVPPPPVTSDPDEESTNDAVLLTDFSDEFDSTQINTTIWDVNTYDWGTWSWRDENAYIEDGDFKIRMKYDPHTRNNTQLYFTSGIIRTNKTITYGYFEASIKGCDLERGACPAFWLFSDSYDPNNLGTFNGAPVTYSEIDIVELQQGNWSDEYKGPTPINQIDFNVNLRIIDKNDENNNGDTTEEIWIRPDIYTELHGHWDAPWDPRDQYHTYGTEVTPESIIWYVDRQEVARQDNLGCHIPMKLTLSMGLRGPYVVYEDGTPIAVDPDVVNEEKFSTVMSVAWVRSWDKRPF